MLLGCVLVLVQETSLIAISTCRRLCTEYKSTSSSTVSQHADMMLCPGCIDISTWRSLVGASTDSLQRDDATLLTQVLRTCANLRPDFEAVQVQYQCQRTSCHVSLPRLVMGTSCGWAVV